MIQLIRYKIHNGKSRPAIFECENSNFKDFHDLDNFRTEIAKRYETDRKNVTFDFKHKKQ